MAKYSTKDYAKKTIKTSQIPPEGIEIIFRGMRSVETKFSKDMYLVDCIHEGEEKDMLFNSVKLAKIFTEFGERFLGMKLRIIPEGSGPQREYEVEEVPATVQGTL
jgi:hypothetical protein